MPSCTAALKAHGDDILCYGRSAALGEVVVCGTLRGTLMAWGHVVSAPPASDEVPNGVPASSAAPYRLLYAKAAHASALRHLACNDAAQCVATASDDATVVVIPYASLCVDVAAADGLLEPSPPLLRLGGHTLPITGICWTATGTHILTTSHDGTLMIHDYARAIADVMQQQSTAKVGGVLKKASASTTSSSSSSLAKSSHQQAVRVVSHSFRVNIGFPATSLCVSADSTYAFVAGRHVARIDLACGSRISEPAVGVLAAMASGSSSVSKSSWFAAAAAASRGSATDPSSSKDETTDSSTVTVGRGVELLRWKSSSETLVDEVDTSSVCQTMYLQEYLQELPANASFTPNGSSFQPKLIAVFGAANTTQTPTTKCVSWTMRHGTDWGRNGVEETLCGGPSCTVEAWKQHWVTEDTAGHMEYTVVADSQDIVAPATSTKAVTHPSRQSNAQPSWTLGYATWKAPILRSGTLKQHTRLCAPWGDVFLAPEGKASDRADGGLEDRVRLSVATSATNASLPMASSSTAVLCLEEQLAECKRRAGEEEERCQQLALRLKERLDSVQSAKKRPRPS
mmetsp:Transcript_5550/g.5989  ORF Transcript_5550/g.5989 Transcript_5550/m.5989 type:complete len:570 (+) Transcript_5550:55-1764(+)